MGQRLPGAATAAATEVAAAGTGTAGRATRDHHARDGGSGSGRAGTVWDAVPAPADVDTGRRCQAGSRPGTEIAPTRGAAGGGAGRRRGGEGLGAFVRWARIDRSVAARRRRPPPDSAAARPDRHAATAAGADGSQTHLFPGGHLNNATPQQSAVFWVTQMISVTRNEFRPTSGITGAKIRDGNVDPCQPLCI